MAIWKVLVAFQRIGLIVASVGVTCIVAGSCVLRFFNLNFLGFEEILTIVVFWLYMFGCANGTFERNHITANIIDVYLKEGIAKRCMILIRNIITTALCAVMFIWVFNFFIQSCGFGDTNPPMTPVFRIPIAVGYLALTVGLGLSLLYFFCDLYGSFMDVVHQGKDPIKDKGSVK
jgi:TRAP-type C4-dicarboxylate transport system permease small subunit